MDDVPVVSLVLWAGVGIMGADAADDRRRDNTLVQDRSSLSGRSFIVKMNRLLRF